MNFNDIISDLKKKIYKPVYFLSGEEPYFIDLISDFIEKKVMNEAEREFNQTVLYGRDTDVATIVGEAKRYPMMSDKMVVIVKEAQNIKNIEELTSYIENPLSSTILVICYKYKTLDKRKTFPKTVAKKGVLFESVKLYENKIPDWIEGYLKERKYTVSPKSTQLLTEYLGVDLGKIVNELEKLMINLPEGSEITPDQIQTNIGISKDFNSFELNNALTKRDVLKANRIVNYFAENSKEHPLVLTISSLHSFFVKLLRYHGLEDKSKENTAKALGVHPFYVNDYIAAAKNYPLTKLKEIFSCLREYDLRSKGMDNLSAKDGELLKELVWKILH